ncbi:MMPL family transporter [Nocardioides sp.]|jgi:RND superfamily putative drug exporter|uniref:MMPL family transporter n=1 Tax=Nocardioides sp. TaxID=35761 RepID=UPI002CE2F729|nr:MMPL family transporter [Nocardioides sp.]HVX53964.1 MMPL family transporter [Nocardioides sp.]
MFGALGRFAARRPWYIIAAWIVFAIVIVATAPAHHSTTDQSDFLPKHYESIKASNLMDSAFPQQQTAGATIVFSKTDGSKISDADAAKIGEVVKGLKLGSDFTKAEDVQVSPTKQVAIVNLDEADNVTGQKQSELDQVPAMRKQLTSLTAGSGLKAQTTGSLPQSYDQSQSGKNAEAIVGAATFLLIIVLLSIIFRSVIIALMPIVLVGIVSGIANGLIAWAAKIFDLKTDDSTTVILIVVLFGIGTDYILFFLFRYRERMRQGEEHRTAVAHALERAGEAIASAGGAVFVAFMTLVLSSLGIFRSIGPSLAIAVAVTLLAALTLVPAVVTVLGSKVLFWPSKKWRNEPRATRFAAIGTLLGKRPGRTAATAGGVLVILTLFCFLWGGFNPTFDLGSSSSANNVESAQATTTMEKGGFTAGATQPTPVVLTSDTGKPLDQSSFQAFEAALGKAKGVAQVSPKALPSPDGKTALFIVTLKADPSSDAAINSIKDGLRPAAHAAAPAGTSAYVGGLTSVFVDFQAAMNRDYAVVFPVAAVIIMIILALLLRSLVAPWYLMVSVGLGFGATLGATVLVFQHIKGDNGLIFLLPIYIYLFVVALGTDYNILMVSRLREEAREGRPPREAAAEAVKHAGPTIAAAGLILAGTFASLMLAGNSLLTTMGFAIAFGIVVAAFVMSLFFTPALTALIGHAAWWPGHGDEKQPERELTSVE